MSSKPHSFHFKLKKKRGQNLQLLKNEMSDAWPILYTSYPRKEINEYLNSKIQFKYLFRFLFGRNL